MIKNHLILEVKKNERVYQMHLSPDSPLGECFDILTEMRSYVLEKINSSVQEEQIKTEQPPKV